MHGTQSVDRKSSSTSELSRPVGNSRSTPAASSSMNSLRGWIGTDFDVRPGTDAAGGRARPAGPSVRNSGRPTVGAGPGGVVGDQSRSPTSEATRGAPNSPLRAGKLDWSSARGGGESGSGVRRIDPGGGIDVSGGAPARGLPGKLGRRGTSARPGDGADAGKAKS